MANANAATFDGINDFLTRGADLDDNADSKLWAWSFWFNRGVISTEQRVYASASDNLRIAFPAASDAILVRAENAAGTQILAIRSSVITDTTGWHHCLGSVDMANAANRHLYIDDVSDLDVVITYTDDTIDFTQSDHVIGALASGNNPLNACLAEVWIAPGVYIDFSVEANRRKFIRGGAAVYLGPDGSFPTGSPPLIYLANPFDSFETNLGSGGDLTENGELTVCTGPMLVPTIGALLAAMESAGPA